MPEAPAPPRARRDPPPRWRQATRPEGKMSSRSPTCSFGKSSFRQVSCGPLSPGAGAVGNKNDDVLGTDRHSDGFACVQPGWRLNGAELDAVDGDDVFLLKAEERRRPRHPAEDLLARRSRGVRTWCRRHLGTFRHRDVLLA